MNEEKNNPRNLPAAPKKPGPAAAPQKNQPVDRPPVKKANMASGQQAGSTRTFDTNKDIKIDRGRQPGGDGSTYNFTGRDIKSSRQRITEPSRKKADDGSGVTVFEDRGKTKRRDDDIETKRGGFLISGILKVVLYIAGVLVVSGILAYNIITIANDVFSFIKEEDSVNVVIPADADIKKIGTILYENGLIRYPAVFDFYIHYRQKGNTWEFEPGVYQVSSSMNYDEFIREFRKKEAAREVVVITIPEGFTIDQIIDTFVTGNGIGTREKFVQVINETDFSEYGYRFLKPLYETAPAPDRKYKLEGYLFPDTYEFFKDESELGIILKFLNNFNVKFDEDCYKTVKALDDAYRKAIGRGISIDDIVNLASMIEKEGKYPEDFPKISAVFHNRLLDRAHYPNLQSDATILYSMETHKSDLTQADLEINLPYNTYTRTGLPPSAICNPGYEAIFAALWPEEKFPYYYFITDINGWAHYSQTYDQHQANKERIRIEKAAAAQE